MRILRSLAIAAIALAFALPASAGFFDPVDKAVIQDASRKALTEPLDQLTKDVEHLHPVAMFYLARRLFEADRKPEAVFWFYAGQIRWRAHLLANKDNMEASQFFRIQSEINTEINEYTYHDIPAWTKTIDDALAWDASHPDDFTPPGEAKEDGRKAMTDLKAYILQHKDEFAKRAAEIDARPKPTADDPYPGSGGALFGTPNDKLKPYEAERFAEFKPGVTTKKDVAKAMGKPEWWASEADGTSSMSYSFYKATAATAMLGMVQNVSVTFIFDANKVLKEVRLPK